jgi:hypothetical protein
MHTTIHAQAVGHVVGGDKSGKESPAGKKAAAAKDGMDVDEEGAGAGGGPKHVLGDANIGLRRTDLDVRTSCCFFRV